jgi:serine/threonine protein kinase
MATDMHRVIRSRQPLSIDHHRYFLYQILRGLKYLHSADIIHCDLQPSNLLVNANCHLKICGFEYVNTFQRRDSRYAVPQFYRAPELLLASPHKTRSSDMWSVGCIFAEFLGRKPIFRGDDKVAVLRQIVQKMGCPPENEYDFITSESARSFLLKLPATNSIPLEQLYPEYREETEALHLLRRMLDFHPRTRCTVEEALSHPFLSALHNPDDEPVADFVFDFPLGGTYQEEELCFASAWSCNFSSSQIEKTKSLLWNLIHE